MYKAAVEVLLAHAFARVQKSLALSVQHDQGAAFLARAPRKRGWGLAVVVVEGHVEALTELVEAEEAHAVEALRLLDLEKQSLV